MLERSISFTEAVTAALFSNEEAAATVGLALCINLMMRHGTNDLTMITLRCVFDASRTTDGLVID